MKFSSAVTFSVVIPVYNAGKYLERCLRSVLCQTHPGFEVIFVDDGSTDGGHAVIASVADPRVRLLRQENNGVSAARNRGIAASQNQYIAFLDADDEWLPSHLETLAGLIDAYPGGGMYSTGFRIQESDSTWPTDVFVRGKNQNLAVVVDPFPLWTVCQVNHCSNTAVSRTVLQNAGLFKQGVAENEDLDLWIRIAALGRHFVYSNHVSSIVHRTPPDGKPRFNKKPDCILACKTALRHLGSWPKGSAIKQRSIQKYIRSLNARYFWGAIYKRQFDSLPHILSNSGGVEHAGIYYWFARRSAFFWLWRWVGVVRSVVLSRLVLWLGGGQRVRKNVVFRLAATEFGWGAYLSRVKRSF